MKSESLKKKRADGYGLEEFYREFLQYAPDLICLVSPEGKIVDPNRTLLATLGYTRGELLEKPVSILYSGAFKKNIKTLLKGLYKNGTVPTEMEAQKKNGEKLLVDLNVSYIRDDHGNIIGFLLVQRDLTERKRVEEALRESERNLKESEEHLRAIFNTAINVSLVTTGTDPEPRILEFNRGAERIFGYKREEVLGKPVAILHTLEDVAKFPEIQGGVRQKRVGYSGEMTLVRKSGEEFPAFFTNQPIFDSEDNVVASLCVSIDITEQKKMEKELRRSGELYSAIVNGSEDAILELDVKGRIVFANARAAKLAQEGDVSLRGKPIASLFPRLFADELLDMTSRVYELRHSLKYESATHLGQSRKNVLVHMVPIYGHKERVETVLVNIKDTTDLKLAERIRMENLALEEVSRIKSEFLATMSHELRTPLNAIIGYAQLLQDQVYGELNEKQHKQIDTIYTSGAALLNLIDNILDLSRIEAGKMELNPESFNLKDVVLDAHVMCKPLSDNKRHSMEVDVKPGLRVWSDPMRVKQCLNNLLSNAIKFTPDGGRIWIKANNNEDGMVTLSVKDTGRGIPPDKLEAIFQPFYRVDSSSTAEVGGTGLGLTITRKLVEMMGGKLWVESEEGKGSEFHFSLPTHPPVEADGTPAGEGDSASAQTTP